MFRSMVTGLIGNSDFVHVVDQHQDLANIDCTEHNGEKPYDVLLVEGFSSFTGSPDLSTESTAPSVSIIAVEDRGKKAIIFRRLGNDILINNDQAGLIDAIKCAAERS